MQMLIRLIVSAVRFLFCFLVVAPVLNAAGAFTNGVRPWTDYRTIMWVSGSAYREPAKVSLFFERLREMGINAAMVHGDGPVQPLLENKFPYYVENLVTRGLCLKFQSKVTDWDKFVTDWNRSGRGEAAFVRDYCLDDPGWRSSARQQMQALVRKNMAYEPLAYDIRDELSVTVSANPFDYDFNPITLTAFRKWLQEQYPSLEALNTGWETRFSSWDDVRPFTTDQIKNRMAAGEALPRGKPDWSGLQRLRFDAAKARETPTRWNLSPWCDFRSYMDRSLAITLGDLREAARELDPRTPVGIEGTQMPSAWGGYDLWRLSQVLDWVEPYDIGNAREIFGSFMPGKPFLTTVFEKDTDHARRRLWHLLLEGDRGCVVWWSEDVIDWRSEGYSLTPKGKALAPVLKEMTSPLAQLYLHAKRVRDPIYFVYSHPSIQVDWLLESTVDGSSWYRRFSSHEAQHNLMAKKRNAWLKLFQDAGYSPQFVAAETLPQMVKSTNGRAFVFSDARALSDIEVAAADDALVSARLFFDGPAGLFNEHGKLRSAATPLARYTTTNGISVAGRVDGTVRVAAAPVDIAAYNRARHRGTAGEWHAWVQEHAGIPREVSVPPSKAVRVHRFTLGEARLLALERNIDYHMSEDLKQAGGNEALEKPTDVIASLAKGGHVYDLRTGAYLGETNRVTARIDPWQPSLFAVLPAKVSTDVVAELSKGLRRQ